MFNKLFMSLYVWHLLITILKAPNFVTEENRMSRASAFLVAFAFLHSLPNALLLLPNGFDLYDSKTQDMQSMRLLPLFEVYLAFAFLVHSFLAIRSSLSKPFKFVWFLVISGALLNCFLVKHLLDFRFGGFQTSQSSPGHIVSSRLETTFEKFVYLAGVVLAGSHAFSGVRPAWLFRLGFRGDQIPAFSRITQALILSSTCLYLIPIFRTDYLSSRH